MRTALVLLFLLALASLPGALLPQWSLNTAKTANYILDHGAWGRLLNRLGFFGVFASPWYAAIYLLLFTSLVGCLLPRTWEFVGQIRMRPVATPRNLGRLPHSADFFAPGSPDQVADRITGRLRGWRLARRTEPSGSVTLSAEKGYLREVGNLVFHFSLLGLLVAVAVGKLFGFEGSVIVTAGPDPSAGFCSGSPAAYDNFRPGLLVDGTTLAPFCVQVDAFRATYTDGGQASSFVASIRYQTGGQPSSSGWQSRKLQVNDPLRIEGERLYLLGHGYSPTFTVTYADGSTQSRTQPFQPADSAFTSQGAVKFTDPPGYLGNAVLDHQLAIVGIFAPTAVTRDGIMTSSFPAAQKPGVAIEVYRGDLGMEGGKPQSVFAIDQTQVQKGKLRKIDRANLAPGESKKLDDGTVVTFTGYREWVSLQTSYDPAQGWALGSAICLLAGLMTSLTIKRRRVWYRIGPGQAAPGPAPDDLGHLTGRLSGMRRNVVDAAVGGLPPAGLGPEGLGLEGLGPEGPGPEGVGPAGVSTSRVEVGGLARTDQAGYGDEFGKLVSFGRT